MADINDLIAQGAGRRDFSQLGDLFTVYRQGAQAKREDELASARRELGTAIGPDGRLDYGAAALHLLRGGDVFGATALAHVARAIAEREQTQKQSALPPLTTRAQVEDALREAREARAAGKDPSLILKRLRDLGLDVSNF